MRGIGLIAQDPRDRGVLDLAVEAVRAEQQPIARRQVGGDDVDPDLVLRPEGPGDDVSPAIGHRVGRIDDPLADHRRHEAVIVRQLDQPLVAEPVRAAVADVGDGDRVADDHDGTGGSHAGQVRTEAGLAPDRGVGPFDGVHDRVGVGRGRSIGGLVEQSDRQLGRHLARLVAAHPVGDGEQRRSCQEPVLVAGPGQPHIRPGREAGPVSHGRRAPDDGRATPSHVVCRPSQPSVTRGLPDRAVADITDPAGAVVACPQCGTVNGARAKFCSECATPLAATSSPVVPRDAKDRDDPVRRRRRLDRDRRATRSRDAPSSDRTATSLGHPPDHRGARRDRREVHRRRGHGRLRDPGRARGRRPARGPCRRSRSGRQLAALDAEIGASRGLAIRFRTGINTGEVVAGDSVSGGTMVTGDAVNTAARLEQAAPAGEILLGTTHLAAGPRRGHGRCRRTAQRQGQGRPAARLSPALDRSGDGRSRPASRHAAGRP